MNLIFIIIILLVGPTIKSLTYGLSCICFYIFMFLYTQLSTQLNIFHILHTSIYMTYLSISQNYIYTNIMFMYVDHNTNKIELNTNAFFCRMGHNNTISFVDRHLLIMLIRKNSFITLMSYFSCHKVTFHLLFLFFFIKHIK